MLPYSSYNSNGTVGAYSTGPLAVKNIHSTYDVAPFFSETGIYQKSNTTSGNYCNKADGKLTKYSQAGGNKTRRKRKVKRNSKKRTRNIRESLLRPSKSLSKLTGLTETQLKMLELLDIIVFYS